MKTIQTLIEGLRRTPAQWTFRQLPGGSDSPLVKAGVLKPASRSLKFVDCPDCDDCEGGEMPEWYSEPDGAKAGQRLRFTCPHTMEVKDLPEDWIRIWEYDGDRLAALVAEAMGCKVRTPRSSEGFWRLGIIKDAIGKNRRRELLFATRLDSQEDAAFKAIKDNGSILFVGLCECDIPEEQMSRRVFRFSDVLRFDENGRLSVVHDAIAARFGGDGSPRKRKKGTAEDRIAQFLFGFAQSMLRYSEDDRRKVREELKVEWIAQGVGVTIGTVSKAIDTQNVKNIATNESKPWNLTQIYYGICYHEILFEAFKRVAENYGRTLQPKDIDSVSAKVMAAFGQMRSGLGPTKNR